MHILTKYFNGTVLTGTENIREVSHEHGGTGHTGPYTPDVMTTYLETGKIKNIGNK